MGKKRWGWEKKGGRESGERWRMGRDEMGEEDGKVRVRNKIWFELE